MDFTPFLSSISTTPTSATTGQTTYYTGAIQVGSLVRDTDDFLVITRGDDGIRAWCSGDDTLAEELYRQAAPTLLHQTTTTTS